MEYRQFKPDMYIPEGDYPRSPGTHISAVLRSIAGLTGILKKEWVEDLSLTDAREITDLPSILRIVIGLAWEQYYMEKFLPHVSHQPGEQHLDGIYLTPDGECVDVIITQRRAKLALILHEVKTTYKSLRHFDLAAQWLYITQLKAYCKAMDTRFAMMHILFMCGDYSYPIQPQIMCWEIEFTQEEIDQTWEDLVEYARHRERLDAEEKEQ